MVVQVYRLACYGRILLTGLFGAVSCRKSKKSSRRVGQSSSARHTYTHPLSSTVHRGGGSPLALVVLGNTVSAHTVRLGSVALTPKRRPDRLCRWPRLWSLRQQKAAVGVRAPVASWPCRGRSKTGQYRPRRARRQPRVSGCCRRDAVETRTEASNDHAILFASKCASDSGKPLCSSLGARLPAWLD